jgi:hypothetical protein
MSTAGLWSGSDGVTRAKTSAAHRQHLNALYTGDELFAEVMHLVPDSNHIPDPDSIDCAGTQCGCK